MPGAEGRAGMAAIVEPDDGLDLKKFLQAVKRQLPTYAVPLFVRVVEKVDLTGTYDYCKMPYVIVFLSSNIAPRIFGARCYCFVSGTFKLKKLALQREGYNPQLVSDPIYFLDAAKGMYKPLDDQIYEEIQNQGIRI